MSTPTTTPTRPVLRRLADVRADNNGVLSVYLGLDPSVVPTPADRSTEIQSIVDEARERFTSGDLSHDEKKEREATVDRLDAALKDRDIVKDGTRGIAVFAAPSADLFEVLRLGDPVAPAVVVDESPYVRPLADEAGPRMWAVLLVDRKHARILYGGPHRLVEVATEESNTPSHQQQGGWSQQRFQRHSDEAAAEHVESALERLLHFYENVKFDALAIAAPDPLYDDVCGRLHSYLRDRLQGRIRIEIDFPSVPQVLEEARPVFEEARTKAIDVLLESLDESSRDRVAIGPEATLQALSERRVDTLVLGERFELAGRRCPECGWIGLDATSCPFDQTATEERADIVDEAVDAAFGQAATVARVPFEFERQPEQPMSALLRF